VRRFEGFDTGGHDGMTQAICDFVYDDLVLRRNAQQSLQEQIFVGLRRLIVKGRLRRGNRMPSSRRLAAERGISRTTVVEAYERLAAEGYVVARPRAGYFVADVLPEEFSTQVRQSSTTRPGATPGTPPAEEFLLPLAPGIPAIDRFPWPLWTKLSAHVLRARPARAIAFPDARGERRLREAVADYLGTFRGIPCSAEQVVIANGSQPIVEMLVHSIAAPGDAVWFEEPGDPTSRAVLKALGLQPVPIRVDNEGLDIDEGRRLAPRARLALVAPSHHYPLGVTMSEERRRALLDWAAEGKSWIIENEIDGDYRFAREPREPLYTLDTTGRVIYLGSFNKAVAPGLRVGYAVLPPTLVPATPISAMVSVPQQLLLAEFWASGHLAAHIRYLRQIHRRRRTALLASLTETTAGLLDIDPIPEAGLRVAALLPHGTDDERIVDRCIAEGIGLGRPLSQCYALGGGRPGLCIGFASTPTRSVASAVRTLAALIQGEKSANA
jgi:GntR family transcriptional regulator / MocR family aminotransferase